MSYTQKKSQTKPVIMFSTFAGTYDFTHRKHDRESVPAIADSCKKKKLEGLTRVTKVCMAIQMEKGHYSGQRK